MLLAGYCLLSYGWNYQHISKISLLLTVSFQAIPTFAAGGKAVCHLC